MDPENNMQNHLADGQTLVFPVIEEEITVGKRDVEIGKVLISKRVYEEESIVNALLTSEEVTVERREINQYIDHAPPAIRQENGVTIISVIKEVLVVEKRLMLVEELHVTKHKTTNSTTINETLRKEEITITRSAPGTDI
ncbi:YsnF/AvaK domain-containing protein [Dyadobacter sp. NIV53]|uniref:YsnF/AvaK domain-containing protein n=1 Tax=Dyadobacter sp. NIV53 TaxID=2861765 RepID=UPI001C888668|nr:YsnF/AvaK domain-containing protein [Dyadobacter sp. NIV53]